jgi:hypothetical protein
MDVFAQYITRVYKFSKRGTASQNSTHQKGDPSFVQYPASTLITRHLTKFSRRSDLAPWIAHLWFITFGFNSFWLRELLVTRLLLFLWMYNWISVYTLMFCCHWSFANFGYVRKVKAIPLQALTGIECSRRMRLTDFKTIGTCKWQSCQPYAPAAFTPREYSWYSSLLEAESTPGPLMRLEESCQWKIPMTPSGIDPATFRFVAQCHNYCAVM